MMATVAFMRGIISHHGWPDSDPCRHGGRQEADSGGAGTHGRRGMTSDGRLLVRGLPEAY